MALIRAAVAASRSEGRPVMVLYHSHLDAGAYFSPTDAAAMSQGKMPEVEGGAIEMGPGPPWPLAFLVTSVRGGSDRRARTVRVGRGIDLLRSLHIHGRRLAMQRRRRREPRFSFQQTAFCIQENRFMSDGFIVWFTGLSGAGKSTLAAMLSAELRERGVRVEVLDGDEVRTHLSKGLGFSKEDRDTNIRASASSPSSSPARARARSRPRSAPTARSATSSGPRPPRFVEVYCSCSIPALADRDAKGLYKKALAGEIKHFTGIDDPYERRSPPR
jgi:adenylyl-sulfate kinase